ncbi:MAG TPA: amino acid adenylation domain-containing protein [Streptosporangiaceae bacterium]|jgi:amino acid adenylation domain-containing protein
MSGHALADVLPLSPAQEGLLYHAQLDDGGPDAYVVQSRFHVEGEVDAAALRQAVDGLLARHQNLRACFRHRGLDRPVQVVPARVAVPWAEADLSGYGAAAQDAELERLMVADLARRFDVGRPPLLRCTLARRGPGQAELLLTVHHILLDGWSMPVLARELGELYAGRGAGLPAAPPYRAYLAWLGSLDFDAAARAWSAALAGAPPTVLAQRPPSADGPAAGPRRPATTELTLPQDLSDAVHRRARECGVTVSTVIRAAWGLVLARMTGTGDVVFGTVASCRPAELAGVEAMVGLLANLLPVRVRLRPGERVGELLGRLQQEQLSLLPHQNARLSDVRRLLHADELFDTVLAVQNYPRAGLAVTGTGLGLAEVRDGTHYPVTLSVITAGRLFLRLDCRPEQVSREAAAALVARFSRALELVADAPDAPADQLEILPEAERRSLLSFSGGTVSGGTVSGGTVLPQSGDTIPGQFAAWAARAPDAPAVVADGCELSYAELNARADELAGRLAAAGVRREIPVALLAPRSPELVVAQLAILKAGGCCVPLDPGQPEARLSSLARRAGARVLLADQQPGWIADDVPVVRITQAGPGRESAVPVPAPGPDTAAYLMYTSGSTGEPKGVILTHRNVTELAAEPRFRDGRRRRVLLHSPHTFDASLYELWATLLTGAAVVLAPAGAVQPGALEEVVHRHQVTDAWLTAELFRTVADLRPGALAGLTQVWTGGDVVAPDAVVRVLQRCPRTTVINGYGPTEATTFATCHEVPRPGSAEPVPVGRPLGGTRAYVLDARLRLAAAGTVGELYLSGTGLARGYAGEPGMTAGRFVAVPLAGEPGARMYRTGDLARWTAGGDLEFAGRADRQVKIRGHRAEPAEIEAVLERCPGVTRAVVSAQPGPGGGQRLVASLVLEPGTDLTAIRRHAGALLPAPLVPAGYVPVATLPLTRHGKVDRAALLASPYREPPARAPRTPLEKSLCGLFAEVLDVPAAGPDTDFFDAGGHSLLAMRLVAAVEALTRTRLPISAVLESPTPAALAERLDGPSAGAPLGRSRLLTLRAAGGRTPLFCLHEGLGLAWSYAVLLRYLPDRPLYALQSPALRGDGPGPASIEELADSYLAQIRAVQPTGPYLLLGASFGGLLAYQLAVALRQAGERLGLVALLDAIPHRVFDETGESLEPALVEQAALAAVLGDHAAALTAAGGRLSRAAVFPVVREGNGPLRGSDDRWLAILTDACARHIRMAHGYQPPRYDGTLTLFSARTAGLGAAEKAAAWRRTAAGVRCHELDCAHGHILRPSPAAEIISFLAPELEEL